MLVLLIICLLSACKNKIAKTSENPPKETLPKALSESASGIEIDSYVISKRGYNLVEDLYAELVSKNSDLQQLEKNIANLQKEKVTQTQVFFEFNQKSLNYYQSATSEVNGIKDSILKQKMLSIIMGHQEKYKGQTLHFLNLIENTAVNENTINDYHAILKIVLTIPLIEKYQKNSMPNDTGTTSFIQKQNAQIQKLENMTKIDKK